MGLGLQSFMIGEASCPHSHRQPRIHAAACVPLGACRAGCITLDHAEPLPLSVHAVIACATVSAGCRHANAVDSPCTQQCGLLHAGKQHLMHVLTPRLRA